MLRTIAIVILIISGFVFQNCSPGKAASDSTVAATTTVSTGTPKVLGLYDLNQIQTLRYYSTGGMLAGPVPQFSFDFASSVASITMVNNETQQTICTVNIPITPAQVAQATAALLEAQLQTAPQHDGIVVDCSYSYLEITMKDLSRHTYLVNINVCTPGGALVIVDGNLNLSSLLQAFAASQTCTGS